MQSLLSSLSAFGINSNELENVGLSLPMSLLADSDKEVCYETKKGKYCELIPTRDGITCDDKGNCDIYTVSANTKLANNNNVLDAVGVKTFLQPNGAFPLVGLSGQFNIKNLEMIRSIVGKTVPVSKVTTVRTMSKGYAQPPKGCNNLPFMPQCKNYIENPEWVWVPFKGWIEPTKIFSNPFQFFKKQKGRQKITPQQHPTTTQKGSRLLSTKTKTDDSGQDGK